MLKKKVLIFSPTFNEKNNVISFLNYFKLNYSNFDLLIVDDNSPDNTFLILKLNSLNDKNIKVIKRKKKNGFRYSIQICFDLCI